MRRRRLVPPYKARRLAAEREARAVALQDALMRMGIPCVGRRRDPLTPQAPGTAASPEQR